MTPARAARRLPRFPLGVEVVAVVCDPGSVPGLRRLGPQRLTIGYLERPAPRARPAAAVA